MKINYLHEICNLICVFVVKWFGFYIHDVICKCIDFMIPRKGV